MRQRGDNDREREGEREDKLHQTYREIVEDRKGDKNRERGKKESQWEREKGKQYKVESE